MVSCGGYGIPVFVRRWANAGKDNGEAADPLPLCHGQCGDPRRTTDSSVDI